MAHKTRLLQLLLLAVASILLVYCFRDYIWSQSVDIAHHYSLVARLSEFGHLPAQIDLSLGEMEVYPSLTHQLAVKAGRIFGSPLIGMQLVVLSSMVVLWAAIGWILWSLPRPAARRVFVLLIGLLLVNCFAIRLELFDREIIDNYFYSQLVAQAAGMVAIAVALRLSQMRVSPIGIYAFLLLSTLVVESMHLLPAVELFGFLGLLIATDLLSAPRERKFRSFGWAAAFFALAALAVIKHPTFGAMKSISENNGTLRLHLIPNLYVLVVLAMIVGALSTRLLWSWMKLRSDDDRRSHLAIRYSALFSLAVAILCLLQTVALMAGQGSEYACRKYAFALCTMLFVNVALLPATRRSVAAAPTVGTGRLLLANALDTGVLAALVVVSFLTNVPWEKAWSLSKLVSLERELNLLNESYVSHDVDKANYVVKLPNQSPLIDYMFSIGIFKTPRTDNAYDILRSRLLSEPGQIGNIITGRGVQPYDVAACRRAAPGGPLVVVDGACFVKAVPRRSLCEGWFHLTPASWIDRGVLHGFSSPEVSGSWTDGNQATFNCKMPADLRDRPKTVQIVTHGFVERDHEQRVAISVNNGPPVQRRFTTVGQEYVIDLPIPEDASKVEIKFSLPDAISPQELGLSSDSRKLGVYVDWIRFSLNSTFE